MKPFLVVLALAFSVAAQPHRPPQPPPPPPNDDALAAYVQLTDAQQVSWRADRDEFDVATQTARNAVRSLHVQLDQLMESKSTDATAIGQLMISIRNQH